jgi:hypothetical protein
VGGQRKFKFKQNVFIQSSKCANVSSVFAQWFMVSCVLAVRREIHFKYLKYLVVDNRSVFISRSIPFINIVPSLIRPTCQVRYCLSRFNNLKIIAA